jgi:hypothetical protein
MANDSRMRRVAGRADGPDYANVMPVGDHLGPGALLTQNVQAVLSEQLSSTLATSTDQNLKNSRRHGAAIYRARLYADNASLVGIGPLWRFDKWVAGQWDNGAAGNDFSADTDDAQDAGGGNDFDLYPAGPAVNDGFVVACSHVFSSLRVTVTVAQADDGGPAFTAGWLYWNGSAWSALATLAASAVPSTIFETVAVREVLFQPPADWSSAAPPEGIPAGHFAVRWRATVVGGTPTWPRANQIQVGHPLLCRDRLAAAGAAELVNSNYPIHADAGDGIQACWSAADVNNWAYVQSENNGWIHDAGEKY